VLQLSCCHSQFEYDSSSPVLAMEQSATEAPALLLLAVQAMQLFFTGILNKLREPAPVKLYEQVILHQCKLYKKLHEPTLTQTV